MNYNIRQILEFLSELTLNNNTEWFHAHRAEYDAARSSFIALTQEYIDRLTAIEPSYKELQPKDCIWRINRDIRFSADKSPYKNHFGAFPAAPKPGLPSSSGGKKSDRGGYYIHLQPGCCMFTAGIWGPTPNLLTALRKEIYANYEEVEQIMSTKTWKRYFGSDFDSYAGWDLKTMPAGFDKDFKHPEWLRHKAFTVSCYLSDETVCSPDFMDKLMDISRAAQPMNKFLNFTFEEYGEFPRPIEKRR